MDGKDGSKCNNPQRASKLKPCIKLRPVDDAPSVSHGDHVLQSTLYQTPGLDNDRMLQLRAQCGHLQIKINAMFDQHRIRSQNKLGD